MSGKPVDKKRSNADWLRDLSGQGEGQAAALGELRVLLLRAA